MNDPAIWTGQPDLVGEPAEFLRASRDRLQAWQRVSDSSGAQVTRLYSAAVDNTLRAVHRRLAADEPWLKDDFCIVAAGGYGRRELCPFSDVDLLLITSGRAEDKLEAATQGLLYPLWDNRLGVGHHIGTTEELLARAAEDLTLQTSLLELRFLAGSQPLFDRFVDALAPAVTGWRQRLLGRVRQENLDRFSRFGESVFLLEPQVKEGKGGLRDFHWLLWIGRLEHNLRGSYDLLLGGQVEPDHFRALMEARDFLLRVRVQLHLDAGRAQDVLRFESQAEVARALGFRKAGRLLAVERFMGEYYRHAYAMAHHVGLYVARWLHFYWDEPEQAPSHGALQFGPSTPILHSGLDNQRSEDGHFERRAGAVHILDPAGLTRHPERILALFGFLQSGGGRLHHDAMEHVRSALPKVGKRFRGDPAVAARFRAILEGSNVFRILAAMHRCGFLGKYIPEFGACFCQAQHNRVHLYTVDVHSLYVVRELEGLGTDAHRESAEPFAEAWANRSQRGPLIMAGLLHDIAKGRGGAHSRVGADLAVKVLKRMSWDEGEIARVKWLVLHHLALVETAYHRDLFDPETRRRLQSVVPDRAHLDDLMALTWADTRGTNPSLLNSWRQSLLEQAYGVAVQILDPEAAEEDATALRDNVEDLLVAEIGRRAALPVAERFFAGEDAGSFTRNPPEDLAEQALLLDRLGDQPFVSEGRPRYALGVSVWVVVAPDRPGLLWRLAGALAAASLSIAAAEARTRSDGIAVDTFYVTDARGRVVEDARRWKAVDRFVAIALRSPDELDEAVKHARRQARTPKQPGAMELQRVVVSNDQADRATLVEVVTPDRPGLVYDLARSLAEHSLDLRVAKISTRHDLASDTFYVTNAQGRRLSKRECRRLEASLREQFA